MRLLFIDFETYYDKDYSLKKIPTVLYVRDNRFKVLGCSIAFGDEPARWLEPEGFQAFVDETDWTGVTVVAHNALFDGLILVERYGVKPKGYVCTQAMARALLPVDSSSLKMVAKVLGLGEKGDALVAGSDIVTQVLVDYANNDLELCRGIYRKLRPFFPDKEMDLISLTIKWGVEARLELDEDLLVEAINEEKEKRNAAIAASGYTEDELSSNVKFAAILRDLGIDVPTKISKTTNEETEAFAKNDPEFQELMASYPEHRPLWEGRMAAKSLQGVRRTERFLEIRRAGNGRLPMPTNYYGGHTGRWSGTGGYNVQNLKRGSKQRKAIKAPKGKVIVVVDASQIELRFNMWFAGQWDKVEILGNKGDIYRAEAASQFGKNPEEVTKDERQFGKVVQLGCGFGMGWLTFKQTCAGGPLGMNPILLSDEEAYQTIYRYRQGNPMVKEVWDWFQDCIPEMMLPSCSIERGPIRIVHEAIELPNGMALQYPGLRPNEQGNWEYGIDKKVSYIYGGKMDENVIQALARIVLADALLEIEKCFETVSSTHDEAIYLVDESEAEAALAYGIEVMSRTPRWAPGLPLAAEGGFAAEYSK